MKKIGQLTLVGFFLFAGAAFAQTATPTNTPTVTPTVTPTPTDTPTVTPTPIPTTALPSPFRVDNLETKAATWLGLPGHPPLAPVDDGRIYFDTVAEDFMCSKNGGAYGSCLGGGGALPTATPVIFTCPTPTDAVNSYDGTTGNTTCVGFTTTCPAGANTDVQYNDSSACGGDANLTWTKGTSVLQVQNATSGHFSLLNVVNTSNTSTSGAWMKIANAGTGANADEGISFDVGSGVSTNRFLNIGRISDSGGAFRWISNSTFLPDEHTGTGWLELTMDTAPPQFALHMDGNATVPGLAAIADKATGFSRTTTGGLHRLFSIIVANGPVFKIEHEITGEHSAGVDGRWRLYHAAPAALTGAGPAAVFPTNALMEISTTNGAGTSITLDVTNVHEGEVLKVMNTAANDITIQTASGAGFCQKTNGGAIQTLADDGSNIEFIAHNACWVQSGPVNDPS